MTDVDLDSGDPPWAEDDDAPERDANTDDMFGAPAAKPVEPERAPRSHGRRRPPE